MVDRIRGALHDFIKTANANKANSRRVLAVNERLAARFRRTTAGDNILQAMIAGRIGMLREAIDFQDRQIKAANVALDLLKEYEFETEGRPPAAASGLRL